MTNRNTVEIAQAVLSQERERFDSTYRDVQCCDRDDVFSSAQVRVLERITQNGISAQSIEAYIRICVRNAIHDAFVAFTRQRKQNKPSDLLDTVPVKESGASDESRVLSLIEQLPKPYRDVLRIKFLSKQKVTDEKLAAILGIGKRTAQLRLEIARNKLRQLMQMVV